MKKKGFSILLILLILISSTITVFGADVQLKSIKLDKTALTINKHDIVTLNVTYNPTNNTVSKAVKWTSSDSNIVYVSGGRIKGMNPGTATITANCNGKTTTCKVIVKAPITKMSLDVTSKTINQCDSFGIGVTYTPANTTDSKTITWTSSNTKIATVKNGCVTGISPGTATITAKMGTKTATCKVTVKAKTIKTVDCYTELNNYRTKAGLKKLTKDSQLEQIAKLRAEEIVKNFDHKTYYTYNSKTKKFVKGKSLRKPTDLIKEVKGNVYRGENIAYGQKTPKEVTTAWYNSSGHRQNMLNKNFTKVGIAYYIYGGKIYWVQIFSS